MIDLDQLEAGLEQALTDELKVLRGVTPVVPLRPAPPSPAKAPLAPARPRAAEVRPVQPLRQPQSAPPSAIAEPDDAKPSGPDNAEPSGPDNAEPSGPDEDRRIAGLVAQGRMVEADKAIGQSGNPMGWRIMRALLDGRSHEACSSLAVARRLGRGERFWAQRYWVALEWGDPAEQDAVLDHCRERAYRNGEPAWRAALALLLARLGRVDEASRELATSVAGLHAIAQDQDWLDIVTSVAEAAALLGDVHAAATADALLKAATLKAPVWDPIVVVASGWACKGAVARYQGLAASAQGHWEAADRFFHEAEDTHRDLGAGPLLARTLVERGRNLLGHDDARAHRYLDEGVALADGLRLAGVLALAS